MHAPDAEANLSRPAVAAALLAGGPVRRRDRGLYGCNDGAAAEHRIRREPVYTLHCSACLNACVSRAENRKCSAAVRALFQLHR